jgi:hypothetical protein
VTAIIRLRVMPCEATAARPKARAA